MILSVNHFWKERSLTQEQLTVHPYSRCDGCVLFIYKKYFQCMLNIRAAPLSSGGYNAGTNQVGAEARWGSEVHKSSEDRYIPEVHLHSHNPETPRSDAGKLNSVIRYKSAKGQGQSVEQTLAAPWNGNRKKKGGAWCERFEALAANRKYICRCVVCIC